MSQRRDSRGALTSFLVASVVFIASIIWMPSRESAILAQESQPTETATFSKRELVIRYSRLSGEEAVGIGINSEYAEVAALAFQGASIKPEDMTIEPLYREVVEEMRAQGLNENLALLSLVNKRQNTSERFLASRFFEQLQERKSIYGFARAFVARVKDGVSVENIIAFINRERGRFKNAGFVVRAFPLTLSPIAGSQIEKTQLALAPAVTNCRNVAGRVAIVADQFTVRADLAKLSFAPLMGAELRDGCDGSAYRAESESSGTNLAGVVANVCPSCNILGYDAGCSSSGKAITRSPEVARGILEAVLAGAQVILIPIADAKKDSVYDEALVAATSAGAVVVAPVGDESASAMRYPAASKGVIGVGATGETGQRSGFSNFGAWVVASARGERVSTLHKASETTTRSSTVLAAARVSGFIARYLTLYPNATLPNIAVLASSGALSEQDPKECEGVGSGVVPVAVPDNGAASSSGSGNSGTGAPSGGTSGGGSGTGSNSSASFGAGSSATPAATQTAIASETPISNTGANVTPSTRLLATLALPDAVTRDRSGVSPFAVQKFLSALSSGSVQVGTASTLEAKTESFTSKGTATVADVVYRKGSAAEKALQAFSLVGGAIQIDQETKEYSQTISVPEETNIKETFGNVDGVVGVYMREARPTAQASVTTMTSSADSGVSISSALGDNQQALQEMGWNDGVVEFTERLKERVKVAILSTGLEYERPEFKSSVSSNLLVTSSYVDSNNQFIRGDFPTDIDGFGTQVASLLGHEELGIARKFVELIPIKVALTPSRLSLGDITRGIALAVNKGAEVIVLPHDFNQEGCNPVLGHAIYKAREKGVTFITGAGDGLRNGADEAVGYPVVAARDDGPAAYETTSNAACWSRYFLGALSFAASEGFAKPLPNSSNYGDDIEMSAMGVGIDAAGLNNVAKKGQGTAFSAAWGAAAAAMAIAHHKTLGFRYGAWYVENLIVASAKRDPNAMNYARHNRFGSFLNFESLAQLLVRTESMTETQRRNDIETINPRQGDGWKPGEDKAFLRYVALSLTKASARPGEELSYRVTAYFRDGSEKDVTTDLKNTTISIQAVQGKRYIEPVEPGKLRVVDAEAFKHFKGKPTFTVSANFNYEQAQGFDSSAVRIDLEGKQRELLELKIALPKTQIRVGQELNLFTAEAKYSDSTTENVTGGASWSTSEPKELQARLAPGVIDARNAVAGKTYSVTATFQSKTATIPVTVVGESFKSFYIHNYLGIGGKIERGQKVTLEARMVLTADGKDREQAMNAVWYNGNTVLNSGLQTRSLTVDTTYLTPGTYTYRAVGVFKSGAGNIEQSATIQFVVADEIARAEIHLKTPIVQIGQPFFIDLRAYRHNNSYVVVTEDATWTTSEPKFASINRSGIGFVSDDFLGSYLTVYADYKGQKAQITVTVIRGSVVTGSNSLIDYITMGVYIDSSLRRYCNFPGVSAKAKYKDGNTRWLNVASVSYAEQRPDGTWGDAKLPLYGGRTYRASITYNDGSTSSGGGGNAVASTTFTMPKENLEKIDFGLSGKIPVIFRNSESGIRYFYQSAVCALSSSSSEPAGIRTSFGSSYVNVSPDSLGLYTVKAQGYYTGMGVRELKQGEFNVDIKDAVPILLNVVERMYPENNSLFSAYGSRILEITLVDSEKRRVFFDLKDLDIKLYQGTNEINLATDLRRKMVLSYSGVRSQHDVTLHLYPKSLGESYNFKVTYKPTGFSAAREFTDIGSWEASDTTPWDLPSTEPPKKNDAVHPACQEYFKTPTALEFAGGVGSDEDPLIICTVEQLKKLGQGVIERSNYCVEKSKTQAPCKRNKEYQSALRLGANIDFKGEAIKSIQLSSAAALDGEMHAISNYIIVDSEQYYQALFGNYGMRAVSNLIIENPTVRGNSYVAALAANSEPISARNVTVMGGVVWGRSHVGGVALYLKNSKNVRVIGTEVRFERYGVGGVAQFLRGDNTQLLFAGRIASAGVPGNSDSIGGIAMSNNGATASNLLMTGDVVTLNSYTGHVFVGGIVGQNDGLLVNTEMRGNVVSTGGGVGGITGVNWGVSHGQRQFASFGLDRLKPHPSGESFYRAKGIIRAKVSGSVWGGMTRKQLECVDKVAKILGVGGGTNCVGDIQSQIGGRSDVGGIAGINYGLIQDSEFSGTVRAINGVGGIVGSDSSGSQGIANYVRNTSAGAVSASDGAKDYGALIGYAPFLLDTIPPRLDSNIIKPGDGNPTWAIGKWGPKEFQSKITSNVPDFYDR